jgi:hypothetical protein
MGKRPSPSDPAASAFPIQIGGSTAETMPKEAPPGYLPGGLRSAASRQTGDTSFSSCSVSFMFSR